MKTNKFLMAVSLICLGIVSGCSSDTEVKKPDEPYEIKANYPKELEGCKTFRVYTETEPGYAGGQSLIITRCPNSSTQTTYGKNMKTSTQELPNNQKP